MSKKFVKSPSFRYSNSTIQIDSECLSVFCGVVRFFVAQNPEFLSNQVMDMLADMSKTIQKISHSNERIYLSYFKSDFLEDVPKSSSDK